MYKCAIVGVGGGRARGHAEAYQQIARGKLAAVSTRRRERLEAFGEQFGVQAQYTDYREMFQVERPDLVHVNTPPDVRLEVLEAADAAGVPAVIVEKPLAIQGEDYLAIREFSRRCRVKIAVNHQLHFHPRRQMLQDVVLEGKVGEVRFIEASCGMNLAYQGTHTLQAIGAFHPSGIPAMVFGQVAGAEGLTETPKQHFSPDACLAGIGFEDGLRAQLQCGPKAPRVGEGGINTHKRIAVYGTRGYVHWTMHSWETGCDGKVEGGSHAYPAEDILGQAAMTEATFDWMEDEKAGHPLNLDAALRDFNVVLGIYTSALRHEAVDLPVEPEENLIAALRNRLGEGEARGL